MSNSKGSAPETSELSKHRLEILREIRAQALAERERRQLEHRLKGDFPQFAALLDIQDKDRVKRKLRPNAIQSAFEISRSGWDIVLKPRQVGLTTWELARDVWYFVTKPGAHVVVMCQSMAGDMAIRENADKLRVMFESLEAAGIRMVKQRSMTEWHIPGRDAWLQIVGAGASEARAAKAGRTMSIHRLHVTELSIFEYAAETMGAVLGSVPDIRRGSEIAIESTAKGAVGYFFELYQGAKSGQKAFRTHFFPWHEHAEYSTPLEDGEVVVAESERELELVQKYAITAEQLKWYRQKVGDRGQDNVDQEFPSDEATCWLTDGRVFFDRERTKALLGAAKPVLESRVVGKQGSHGVLRIWKHPQPGRKYVIAVDPSEGVGGDPGAAVVLDRGSGEHVATVHGQFSTWEMARVCAEVGHLYADALIAVERNNHGHAVLQGLLREQKYRNVYAGPDKRAGWVNTEVSRASALDALHNAHREGHWSSSDKAGLEEMLHFVVVDGKPQAAAGGHDDIVLAYAIGWDVVCHPTVDRYVPTGMVA